MGILGSAAFLIVSGCLNGTASSTFSWGLISSGMSEISTPPTMTDFNIHPKIKKMAEAQKIALRNSRRDAINKIDAEKKAGRLHAVVNCAGVT